jgi:hypothetical protein
LPKLVEKTKETYVLPLLIRCYCVTANFDLWMSKGAHDVFTMIIFLGFEWKLMHMMMLEPILYLHILRNLGYNSLFLVILILWT